MKRDSPRLKSVTLAHLHTYTHGKTSISIEENRTGALTHAAQHTHTHTTHGYLGAPRPAQGALGDGEKRDSEREVAGEVI